MVWLLAAREAEDVAFGVFSPVAAPSPIFAIVRMYIFTPLSIQSCPQVFLETLQIVTKGHYRAIEKNRNVNLNKVLNRETSCFKGRFRVFFT